MKTLILSFLTVMAVAATAPAFAACDHSWQSASDGSACGGRAADMRPGGRP